LVISTECHYVIPSMRFLIVLTITMVGTGGRTLIALSIGTVEQQIPVVLSRFKVPNYVNLAIAFVCCPVAYDRHRGVRVLRDSMTTLVFRS